MALGCRSFNPRKPAVCEQQFSGWFRPGALNYYLVPVVQTQTCFTITVFTVRFFFGLYFKPLVGGIGSKEAVIIAGKNKRSKEEASPDKKKKKKSKGKQNKYFHK